LPNVMTDQAGKPKTQPSEAESPLTRLFNMCDPKQAKEFYTPERRSVRIHGHSTTIRLESAFWTVLEDLAAEEQTTVAGLITLIHDRCQFSDFSNLASCLRVVGLKYIEYYASTSPDKST